MKVITLILILLSLGLIGCASRVSGNLEVDGTPFEAKECRSGQAFGFSGVELTDKNDRRLRLFASPDGTCSAALLDGSAPTGDRLGSCGTLTVEAQSSKINNITNIKGNAKLSCAAGNHKVSGNVDFENCH